MATREENGAIGMDMRGLPGLSGDVESGDPVAPTASPEATPAPPEIVTDLVREQATVQSEQAPRVEVQPADVVRGLSIELAATGTVEALREASPEEIRDAVNQETNQTITTEQAQEIRDGITLEKVKSWAVNRFKKDWPGAVAGLVAGAGVRSLVRIGVVTSFGASLGTGVAAGFIGGALVEGFKNIYRQKNKFSATDVVFQFNRERDLTKKAALVAKYDALYDEKYKEYKLGGDATALEAAANARNAVKTFLETKIREGEIPEGSELNKIRHILKISEANQAEISKTDKKAAEKLIKSINFAKKRVDMGDIDWKKVLLASGKGALYGTVGGAIGAGISHFVTEYMFGTEATEKLAENAANLKPGVSTEDALKNLQELDKEMAGVPVKGHPEGFSFVAAAKEKLATREFVEKAGFWLEHKNLPEGPTHLARKAVHDYIVNQTILDGESPTIPPLSTEQYIWMEDHLMREAGGAKMALSQGSEMKFSGQKIAEAIEKAKALKPAQLESLKQLLKQPQHNLSKETIAFLHDRAHGTPGNNFVAETVNKIRVEGGIEPLDPAPVVTDNASEIAKKAAGVADGVPEPLGYASGSVAGGELPKPAEAAVDYSSSIKTMVALVGAAEAAGLVVGLGTVGVLSMRSKRNRSETNPPQEHLAIDEGSDQTAPVESEQEEGEHLSEEEVEARAAVVRLAEAEGIPAPEALDEDEELSEEERERALEQTRGVLLGIFATTKDQYRTFGVNTIEPADSLETASAELIKKYSNALYGLVMALNVRRDKLPGLKHILISNRSVPPIGTHIRLSYEGTPQEIAAEFTSQVDRAWEIRNAEAANSASGASGSTEAEAVLPTPEEEPSGDNNEILAKEFPGVTITKEAGKITDEKLAILRKLFSGLSEEELSEVYLTNENEVENDGSLMLDVVNSSESIKENFPEMYERAKTMRESAKRFSEAVTDIESKYEAQIYSTDASSAEKFTRLATFENILQKLDPVSFEGKRFHLYLNERVEVSEQEGDILVDLSLLSDDMEKQIRDQLEEEQEEPEVNPEETVYNPETDEQKEQRIAGLIEDIKTKYDVSIDTGDKYESATLSERLVMLQDLEKALSTLSEETLIGIDRKIRFGDHVNFTGEEFIVLPAKASAKRMARAFNSKIIVT